MACGKKKKKALGTMMLIGAGINALTSLIGSGISAHNNKKQIEANNILTTQQNDLEWRNNLTQQLNNNISDNDSQFANGGQYYDRLKFNRISSRNRNNKAKSLI